MQNFNMAVDKMTLCWSSHRQQKLIEKFQLFAILGFDRETMLDRGIMLYAVYTAIH